MVFEGDKLIAVFPANKENNLLFSHQGLTYGGLIYKANLKFSRVMDCFYALLKYLNKNGFSELIIKPLPRIYEGLPNDELALLLHKSSAIVQRMDGLSVIDLRSPIKIARDRKQGVKRGEKNGLVVREEQELDRFWNEILIPNLQNKHKVEPVHSLDEISNLKRKFPKNIRQFNVYHQGNIVAGAMVFNTKYVAHMQYISGDESRNELGSIDLLHYHLITDVFKDKRYFDFGHSSINSGEQINASLLYWKEGFNARMVQHPTYKLKTANYIYLENYLQ